MRNRLAAAAALLVTACGTVPGGAAATATTTTAISTTTPEAPTTTASVEVEPIPCSSTPPRDFSLLCQSAKLVVDTHLDPPDMKALAAAAGLGVAEVAADQGGPSVAGPLQCAVPDPDAFRSLCQAIAELRAGGGPPVEALVEGAVQGMFRYGLDPFSSYVPPDLAKRLDALGPGAIYSLGVIVGGRDADDAVCGPVSSTCRFTVLAVFPFTPAEREGVVPGDAIQAVDGVDVGGLSVDEASALLAGPPGTAVHLVLDRASGLLEKTLVHEDIRFEPVEFEMLTPSIAYLRLNDFSQVAAQLVGRVLSLDDVESAGGMVLDLRDNPGGLLLAAQAVASQFLDGGLVLVETTRAETYELPVIEGGLARPGMEVVVLVNRGSASASEVVAAVLQERGRATVIGQPTFGKNLIQEVHRARNGGEIRVTVARWTTPGGIDVGIDGLRPDVDVEFRPGTEGDPALEQALSLLGG